MVISSQSYNQKKPGKVEDVTGLNTAGACPGRERAPNRMLRLKRRFICSQTHTKHFLRIISIESIGLGCAASLARRRIKKKPTKFPSNDTVGFAWLCSARHGFAARDAFSADTEQLTSSVFVDGNYREAGVAENGDLTAPALSNMLRCRQCWFQRAPRYCKEF